MMPFDFSILKNKENLIFIAIYFLITAIFVAIVVSVVIRILRFLKYLFKKLFKIEDQKQKNQNYVYDKDIRAIKPKETKEELNEENKNAPAFTPLISSGSKEEKVSFSQQEKEGKEKSISKGLAELKKVSDKNKDPTKLEAMRAKIFGNPEENEDDFHKKIKIPKRKRFFWQKSTALKEETKEELNEENKIIKGAPDSGNKTIESINDEVGIKHGQTEIKTEELPDDAPVAPEKKETKKETKEDAKQEEPVIAKITAREFDRAEKKVQEENKESDDTVVGNLETYKAQAELEKRKKELPQEKEIPLYEKPTPLKNELTWHSKATEKVVEELKKKRFKEMGKEVPARKDGEPLYSPEDIQNILSKSLSRGFSPGKTEKDTVKEPEILLYDKPEILKDDLRGRSKVAETKGPDSSILFGAKSEVSRIDLRQKLRKDPKIWNAERQVGLKLTPIQRAKLEKEVFSQALGGNISKTDVKWGVKKLNRKMLSTKDLEQKGQIRKQIKFFKKIGGIK